LVQVDNELNAFPSLHTAFAILSGACCSVIFRSGNGNKWIGRFIWCWAFGIVASTFLTKQHVFIDVLGGAVVGFAGYIICWRGDRQERQATQS